MVKSDTAPLKLQFFCVPASVQDLLLCLKVKESHHNRSGGIGVCRFVDLCAHSMSRSSSSGELESSFQ